MEGPWAYDKCAHSLVRNPEEGDSWKTSAYVTG